MPYHRVRNPLSTQLEITLRRAGTKPDVATHAGCMVLNERLAFLTSTNTSHDHGYANGTPIFDISKSCETHR